MARASGGWVTTAKIDRLEEYWTSNMLKQPNYENKVEHLPPLHIQYETPRSTASKQWTDQSLIGSESINDFLAESDAFQRASYANLLQKWKRSNQSKTNQSMASFDDRYNMRLRFRQDIQLNRPKETLHAPVAIYYRFRGNEHSHKNDHQCTRYKRRSRQYDEKHIQDLLQLPTRIKTRSRPYILPKLVKLPSISTTTIDSASIKPCESVADVSLQTLD